jgi:hypothetical protein
MCNKLVHDVSAINSEPVLDGFVKEKQGVHR